MKETIKPNLWLRLKVLFWSIILANMFFSWQTKCFSDGVRECVNPEYIGQNYMWSAAGFMVGMIILFVRDCWTLPPRDE